jgi:vitamin B12 transporter
MRHSLRFVFVFLAMISHGSAAEEQPEAHNDASKEVLDEIVVRAKRVANTSPAGSYAAIATSLRFDPQTELQSRGLSEGQSDVTVRGGIFENTGFVLGAATIFDPQTGHYAAGLPIDPAVLSKSLLLTGVKNSLSGFNSNVATVKYALPVISDGGNVSLGMGENDLFYSSLRLANSKRLKSGNQLGFAVSAARSRGDGTLPNGDHDFSRYNLQAQYRQENTQTDLLVSYQDKFYGWPGAYTGFASLPETDHTKTQLLFVNHRREQNDGWLEISAYYRELDDDYDFNRTTQESGSPGSFDHLTRAYAIGFQGSHRRGAIDWRYGGQLTGDKLVRSTDLTEGDFTSRSYLKLSLVPDITIAQSGSRVISARGGVSVDTSNRDSTTVSPVAGFTIEQISSRGSVFYTAQYASASQLPGYTALKSRPSGLFGGNPDLGREESRQLSLSASTEAVDWSAAATIFYRKDDDLVDWTYFTDSPFSRQANPVDLDVLGLELMVRRQWSSLGLVASYTYLDKDEDYATALVDASFYALNYARHRATLAVWWQLSEQFELRLDNEYRRQLDNPLRTSGDTAFISSVSLNWASISLSGFELALTADNLTNSDYQFFPGTPAVGRQLSVSAAYYW